MCRASKKASKRQKASGVPVDLREHSPSALSVDDFSTMSLGPFFRPFQAVGLATLSPRRFVMDHRPLMTRVPEGPSDVRAEFTPKDVQKTSKTGKRDRLFDHLKKQTQRPKTDATSKSTSAKTPNLAGPNSFHCQQTHSLTLFLSRTLCIIRIFKEVESWDNQRADPGTMEEVTKQASPF